MTNPEIGGPRLASVLAPGVWAEDNPCLLVVPIVCEGFGAPESDVVVGAVCEQVPLFVVGRIPRHLNIRHQLVSLPVCLSPRAYIYMCIYTYECHRSTEAQKG